MVVVIRRWVWLDCIGVVSGWCKEVYRFPYNLLCIPTPLVLYSSFLQQQLYLFIF